TLPTLSFSYFDPESERYEVSKTEPIQLNVLPGAGAATVAGTGSTRLEGSIAKNVLASGGLRPLRYQAHFTEPSVPAWRQKSFLPVILGPPGLWLAVALVGLIRSRLTHEDETTLKRKRAKAARRRLALAERLKDSGNPQAFYAEVEN